MQICFAMNGHKDCFRRLFVAYHWLILFLFQSIAETGVQKDEKQMDPDS